MHLSPYMILLLVAGATSLGLALVGMRYRSVPGAVPLSAFMLAAAVWCLSLMLQHAVSPTGLKLLFAKASYLGGATLPVAWLLFALEYTGREEWMTRRRVALLSVLPALTLLAVWTNEFHGLFWQSVAWTQYDATVFMTPTYGPGYWLNLAYAYLVIAAGTFLLLQMLVLSSYSYPGQTILLLAGILVPWAANVAYVLGMAPPGIDPTPPSFAVSGLALSAAIYRFRLLDLVPVAREVARDEMFENLVDGVVVVDVDGRVLDANPAAAELLDAGDVVGESLETVLPELAAELPQDAGRETVERNVRLERAGAPRYFDVHATPLHRGDDLLTGQLVTLRDVTDRRQREQRIDVLNRALRHNLRNDANVILNHAELMVAGDPDADRARAIREKTLDIVDLSEKVRQIQRTLDGGRMEPATADLVSVVEETVAGLRRRYPDAVIETDLPERAPASVTKPVGIALENTVENAIEHNDADSPRVRVSVTDDPERGEVCVEVADDGPGIPPAEREVVARERETPLEHASGVGLWITNWVVSESGGTVEFEGTEPTGTVVRIRLQRAESA